MYKCVNSQIKVTTFDKKTVQCGFTQFSFFTAQIKLMKGIYIGCFLVNAGFSGVIGDFLINELI